MKKTRSFVLVITCTLSYILLFSYGCGKSAAVAPVVKNTGNGSAKILYMIGNTLGNTPGELWSIGADGTGNQKIAVNVPANLHFVFYSDIAAEVAPDSKTMILSLRNSAENIAYLYKCNIDGSGVQQIPNVSGDVYLQTYINSTSILYWKDADSGHNGDLWKINTDGTGNQKINISLPANIGLGDGKFAKVTADGSTIYFSTFNTKNNQTSIYKCNINGSGLTLITSDYSTTIQALLNNTTILDFGYANADDKGTLWLLNADGSNKHTSLVSGSLPAGLTFGDSRIEAVNSSLFFVTETNNSPYIQALYSADTDGSNVKLVTNVPSGYAISLQGIIK